MLLNRRLIKPVVAGVVASGLLLAGYFALVTLVSGWRFAQWQFGDYWYYLISLAVGFGVQISLYVYLKNVVHHSHGTGKAIAVSGTTSTVAMISCCAHYLVTIGPVLGLTGVISVIAQYQIELFWVGLLFNAGGIVFIVRQVYLFRHSI